MPSYHYNAVTLDGSRRTGQKDAASVEQLTSALKDEGLFITKWSTKEMQQQATAKLKTEEIADFCRQLAAMLSAGIMLIRAITIMSQRNVKPHVKKVYDSLIDDLQRGSTLSEAMAKQGRAFPDLLINMVRAGENTGRLDVTAEKMAATYDKEHRLNQKISSATVYPIILVVLIIGVVLILFTFVLPQFMGLFENMELPWPTRVVMAISDFMLAYGLYTIIGVIVAAAGLIMLFRRPGPRKGLDYFKLRIPRIGHLLRTIYTARFARTLSSLYVSGVSMIQALQISRSIIGNTYIEAQFDAVVEALGNGRTLSQAIALVNGFESKLQSTVLIGEESGSLEHMLESVADQYDYDAEMASQRLVTMIEPILIIFMAVIVAFVIISVLLPIFSLYSSVGAEGGL
ncbi:MAG: type II secretion system F family protein [Coriobacteriales bacterium]|jgi:type IV pilus assembly protein PilC|nr:type II secretion system F family protein [Coriobacteriales bacterium]